MRDEPVRADAGVWKSPGDISHRSPRRRLCPVPPAAVRMNHGFWRARMDANRTRSIPLLLERMEEHGFIDNFRRASGRKAVERRERYATDADTFKWIEAVAYTLMDQGDGDLRQALDAVVDEVLAAQGKDGYLNTWFVFDKSADRFTQLPVSHEFFNCGHLIYAAIAHAEATGERALLDAACRYADYLTHVFDPWRPNAGSGHPGLEMALIDLYRVTGCTQYLDLARFLLEWAGINTQQTIEGHCVCTLYLCCAATDYYAETGNETYLASVQRMWNDMVAHKLYVHAGVGSRHFREDFGFPYQLPTLHAYCETCAAVANVLWNARLLALNGEAAYGDLLERVLYNAMLSGVSLQGGEYFYTNPLASVGTYARAPWQSTSCCLPNIQRLIASVPRYVASTDSEGLWVHLYDACTLNWHLPDGRPVRMAQETQYPWDGRVRMTLNLEGDAALFLRIPVWSPQATLRVNGRIETVVPRPGTYHRLRRTWCSGDTVDLELEMPAVFLVPNVRVRDCAGCVAVQRGPLTYCLESVDNPEFSVLAARIRAGRRDATSELVPRFDADLLGGVMVIEAEGCSFPGLGDDSALYATVDGPWPAPCVGKLQLIPYYAWANRGPSQMTVWIPLA